ncbi:MAG: hypothetical protein J6B89_03630 [Bacilli bacterium]|nr:hypothetical protein [Bacilli bacterium]
MEEKDITLEQLEQNLINSLNKKIGVMSDYQEEVELLKIILEYKKD